MAVTIKNPLTVVQTGGGGGTVPLDPVEVYNTTRPADWLKMPEVDPEGDDVVYLLLHIAASTTEDVTFSLGASFVSGSGTITWEFGTTDSGGAFTPNTALTVTKSAASSSVYAEATLPASAFGALTSDGLKQLMCRITTSGPRFRTFYDHRTPESLSCYGLVKEVLVVATSTTQAIQFGENSLHSALRYLTWKGTTDRTSFSQMFQYCSSLTAIPQLDTSKGTNFASMFYGCYSLTAIPQLDTSKGTNFASMFQYCSSLTSIPQLDTSAGTSLYQMFQYCSSLTSIPQLNTSSSTGFSSMFQGCSSLTGIPQLDTSACTNFYQMFTDCSSLTSIPQLDTSAGTNFYQMFRNCYSLTTIPQLDTSAGTSFNQMFNGCYSLTSIPQLDTSAGTSFQNMFSACSSLTDLDFTWLDLSGATSTSAISGIWGNTLYGGKPPLEIGNKWPAAGIANTGGLLSLQAGNYATADYPVRIKINKTDAMLPIATNATTLFTTNQYVYVYVPDALLATYQADTYWATLGTRLKGFSELPS